MMKFYFNVIKIKIVVNLIKTKQMISREEYNKALDIVEAFHKQLFLGNIDNSLRVVGKTPLLEWNKFNLLNTRLQNNLKVIYNYNLEKNNKIIYVENLIWQEFKKCRNAGKIGWDEFVEMRGY